MKTLKRIFKSPKIFYRQCTIYRRKRVPFFRVGVFKSFPGAWQSTLNYIFPDRQEKKWASEAADKLREAIDNDILKALADQAGKPVSNCTYSN